MCAFSPIFAEGWTTAVGCTPGAYLGGWKKSAIARAKVKYGFIERSMAVERAGKFSARITAEARVVLAAAAYFGLARNVIWPGRASSIPATPVISVSGEPFSSRALRAE